MYISNLNKNMLIFLNPKPIWIPTWMKNKAMSGEINLYHGCKKDWRLWDSYSTGLCQTVSHVNMPTITNFQISTES